jgi:outer membrane protein insertion porin family
VIDVRIEGNRAVSMQKVMNEIRTRAGRNFDQLVIVEDIRRLNATHKFVDVRPLYQRVTGGVIVTFQLVERPLLEYVKYVGNASYKTSKMKEQTELAVGAPLDIYQVEEGRRKIENFYHEKGYNNVQVVVLEGNKSADRGAIYLINEGEQQKIFWTNFVGNTIASGARLRTQISSVPGTLWFLKGYVEPKKIDEDIEKLTTYYQNLGFFQVKVGRELNFGESGRWLTLTFVINEGPRYVVRNVSVLGNKKFGNGELLTPELKIKGGQGMFFDQGGMMRDAAVIRDVYGTKGYVFADVKAETRFLEEPGKVDIVYSITEGDRYRIGKINVHVGGDGPHTKLNTVINRFSQRPGDIADTREIKNTERRLKASGLFKVDPQSGLSPKVVFVPPGVDEADRAQYADGPNGNGDGHQAAKRQTPGYRGQSPDTPTPYVVNYPQVQADPNDKFLVWDLYLADEATGVIPEPPAPPATAVRGPAAAAPPASADGQGPWSGYVLPADRVEKRSDLDAAERARWTTGTSRPPEAQQTGSLDPFGGPAATPANQSPAPWQPNWRAR